MKTETLRLPGFMSGVMQVWMRNYLHFKKSLMMNFFWVVLEPLLMLIAFGYGLGSFVSNIQGISYADFFFPALLCMSSMMVSFYEASYGNFAKLTNQKTYNTMILSPLDSRQIVLGEILWSASKGTFSAFSVALIAGVFGHLDRLQLLPAVFVLFISSMLFASLGMVIMSSVKNYDQISVPTSALIIPMSLFSGTYFPLDVLPYGLKYIFYISPLSHTVALVRGLLIGGVTWTQYAVHLALLVVTTALLLRLAYQKLSQKLQN